MRSSSALFFWRAVDMRAKLVEVKGEIAEMKVSVNERLAAVETTMEDMAGQVRFMALSMGVLCTLDDLERRVDDLERDR